MRDDLNSTIGRLKGQRDQTCFEPEVFSLCVPEQRQALQVLLETTPGLLFFDEMYGQLKELVKARHPKKQFFTEADITSLIELHLDGVTLEDYGCWVYYPWNYHLIHLLPENEFVEVRTNRNRNKITQEESILLQQKKVGVIGLSVGQSVSVTMAMERSFGEIRLADFDKLELTNLNRIRTPLHNLGLSKVASVAREIKEIDPFLKVIVFTEGITEDNINRFFQEGGMLDAVIDECDGLDIKVLCRVKAREFKVPVLMEASDRGTIDVERFDLEPNRPLLHGFIDHLDISKIKHLKTNEEKVPYLLPIAGMETLSKKMKASMLEIGQTLTTWPQLSSAVTLGGGITADTYRRMMLDEFRSSGRFFVDTEDILRDGEDERAEETHSEQIQPLSTEVIESIIQPLSVPLDGTENIGETVAKKLVEAAIAAPSGGNNQPWAWKFNKGILYLLHDRARSVSFSDFGDMGAMIAFGACIENVVLQALEMGLKTKIHLFPLKNEPRLIAQFGFYKDQNDSGGEKNIRRDLQQFLFDRHTNRTKSNYMPLNNEHRQALISLASEASEGDFQLIEGREALKELASIIAACERIRIMHPKGHHDFYESEVRWSDEESRKTGDGIDIATIELTAAELAGMKIASDKQVVHYLKKWKGGTGFEKLSREGVETCSAIGLIRVEDQQPGAYINGGRLVQRLWLQATAKQLAIHPVSAGLFMFARLFKGDGLDLSPDEQAELHSLHKRFIRIVPDSKEWNNLFMFRIFYSDKSVVRSYRRPLDEVYH